MEDDGYASTDLKRPRQGQGRRARAAHAGLGAQRQDRARLHRAGAVGAHLRGRDRRLRRLLRPVARERRAVRRRRRGRHRGRPVDRRAGHAADDAHVPYRRRRRPGHHAGSAPRGGAVRGPHAEGGGRRRAHRGSRHQPHQDHRRARLRAAAPGRHRGARGRGRGLRRLLPRRAHDAPAARVADPRHAAHAHRRARLARGRRSCPRASRSCPACSRRPT